MVARLAPSPTGAQHVGNARTYLIAWLSARSQRGTLRLRIEDIDSPRVKVGAVESLFTDLAWLGLDWDGTPVVQTQRVPFYRAALQRLQECELVYPCTCTRSDIANAASAPHAEHEGPSYPGTCAFRRASDAESLGERRFSWRFRAGAASPFQDRLLGPIQLDDGGDFIVWKAGDTPAYQLAVVVDDADMGITEVIRGDDLVPSTPKQLMLYDALGLSSPRFAHVPLVSGPDGKRLAKRHGDTRLSSLREASVSPEALIGLLAWSCGWLDRPEPIRAGELLPKFDLARIPRQPFVLTPALLRDIGYAG